MGRRKGKWLPYDIASVVARREGCDSRNSYKRWHNRAHPNNLPKFPERVYDEWTTWGEFLHTTNVFLQEKRVYRPYWEAVRWAQRFGVEQKLTTSSQWIRFVRNHNDKIPEDIPNRPDGGYKEDWKGWKVWLGVSVKEKIMSAKQNIALMCIVTTRATPKNVLEVIVAPDGFAQMKEMLQRPDIDGVLRTYHWEPDLATEVHTVFNAHGSDQGGDKIWMVRSVDGLFFDLDNILMIYRHES